MYKEITEGQARLIVPKETKVSKKLPVFYNPLMKLNRDLSILLLNAIELDNMQIGLPLAGSGVRGVRFLLELKKGKARNLCMNDMSKEATTLINKNLKANHLDADVFETDANEFLLKSKGFDYIDIDPFGTPNPFLDAGIKRLSRCGVLAITATDTSSLCGTYKNVCLRNYWAIPSRTELMHEAGLRILIRKVQLIGAQYDRALIPIFSYSKDHYMRVFFKSKKSKSKTDEIIKQHDYVKTPSGDSGPMWIGSLNDTMLIEEMIKQNKEEENLKFLELLRDESKINSIFFYDIHSIKKREGIKNNPKKSRLIEEIKKRGFKAGDTHFTGTAIKSDIPYDKFLVILKTL